MEFEKVPVSVGPHTTEVHIHARKVVSIDQSYTTDSYEVVLPRRDLAESNFLAAGTAEIRSVGGDTVGVVLEDTRGEDRKSTHPYVHVVNTPYSGGDGSRHLWAVQRRNSRDCLGL